MNLTWIEIDKKAILSNIREIKRNIPPKTKFLAVIKGNAYGHDLLIIAREILKNVDYLSIYDFKNALLLRKAKIVKPIILLGPIFPTQIKEALENNIEISISNFETLKATTRLKGGKKILAHLCIDTGLGREGFILKDIKKVMGILKEDSNLNIKGLYTHFSGAESRKFDSYTKKQIRELMHWKDCLDSIGIHPLIHASATSGAFASYHLDMARIGVGIYGLWPSKETLEMDDNKTKLTPVLSWKTRIVEVKFLPKGSHISYDCNFKLTRNSKIAVLPVGYYDGIPRTSSNKGKVLVNGRRVSQIGRVMMNTMIIDVTNIGKVSVGDIVTIIGNDKNKMITVEDWAVWSKTINYEIVARINPMIPRILK